jgi:hypothetical protein
MGAAATQPMGANQSSHRGCTVAVLFVLLSGCALDIQFTSSPDTVMVGQQVTYDIKVTNVTACPLGPTSFTVIPLLSSEEEALIDEELAERIELTVADVCEMRLPEEPPEAVMALAADPHRLETLRADLQAQLAAPGRALGGGATSVTITCEPMTRPDGIDFFECSVGPLAPGEMATTQIMLTATAAGVFRNIAFNAVRGARFCDDGANAGMHCVADAECPEAKCLGGRCEGGDNDGYGCAMPDDCPKGECIDCERCNAASTCIAGNTGEECFEGEDCEAGPGRSISACPCGTSLVCTQTTVELVPQGGECESPSQCASGFCVEGVCCNRECSEPFEACNRSGSRGTCTSLTAAAPLLSFGWLPVLTLLLAGVALLGFRRLGPAGR